MVDIIPGILEKEWSIIESRINFVAHHVSWVQIDIADNTLVPNETLLDFENFRAVSKTVSLEGHLMVANPEKYIRSLVDAGFKRLIAHVECQDPRAFLSLAQYEDVEVGVAIDGPTTLDQIEPFLEEVDCALVMMIEAGFSGQEFGPENLDKIKTIRQNFPNLPIEVDGGVNEVSAKFVKDAGATRLVSTSYLFKDVSDIAQRIEALKNA